jgi:adenylosuccinate lyase
MAGTKAGGDRQELHEAFRVHSHATTAAIREGKPNDLAQRLAADPLFTAVDLAAAMESQGLAGRASAQVEEFIAGPVREALRRNPARAAAAALHV